MQIFFYLSKEESVRLHLKYVVYKKLFQSQHFLSFLINLASNLSYGKEVSNSFSLTSISLSLPELKSLLFYIFKQNNLYDKIPPILLTLTVTSSRIELTKH